MSSTGRPDAPATWVGVARQVSLIWLVVGVGALLFRTVQLFFVRDVQAGLVWCARILTVPFHRYLDESCRIRLGKLGATSV